MNPYLHLVEPRTKVASLIPWLFGTLYAQWAFHRFDAANALLMLGSLLCIDLFVSASNNYMDFLHADNRQGYNFETHNPMARYGLHRGRVLGMMLGLFGLGIALGLWLTARTDLVVLGIGAVSFAAGLAYSWGPVPLSRIPAGEAVSGFFMGFVILFLSVYVHGFREGWVRLSLTGWSLTATVSLLVPLRLFVVSIPFMAGIAGIMLANNLCDMEDDGANGRLTLPRLLGPRHARLAATALLAAAYGGAALSLLAGWIPWTCLLMFATLPAVVKSHRRFMAHISKEHTFVESVRQFLLIGGSCTLGLLLGILLRIPG